MKNYNKLVRDRIPEIIEKAGKNPVTRELTEEETEKYLLEKLEEEVAEFKENKDFEELADILEVIEAIVALRGEHMETLEGIKADKKQERGGFRKRILLERVEE